MKCKICGYTWDTGDGGHDCWSVVIGERDTLREAIQGTIGDIDEWTTRRELSKRLVILQELAKGWGD